MTVRTQIYLGSENHRRAKIKAAEAGISLAEYFRRLVARDLGETKKKSQDITAIFNLGNSGGSDIAKYKDEYVGEAVEALHHRSRRPK